MLKMSRKEIVKDYKIIFNEKEEEIWSDECKVGDVVILDVGEEDEKGVFFSNFKNIKVIEQILFKQFNKRKYNY